MSDIVYLNGQFIPQAEAQVSVMDRGFLFGDGVYEVIPVYAGKLFRLTHHLERLAHSLAGVRITNPHDLAGWESILNELVQRHGGGNLSVYLQVTRGAQERRDHLFPDDLAPTVFALCSPMTTKAGPSGGVAAVTRSDIRWSRCDIKAITLLPNVLMKREAMDVDALEAIMIRDGYAVEGSASNLFMVRDGVLITPPKGPFLLPGITRDLVLELALANGVECEERDIPEAELFEADEIWITSSTREIVPVTQLDDRPVGDGKPGPLHERLLSIYQDYKQQLQRGGAA